jgi:acyl-coenzyme A thioesterase PaaI-like protein
LSARAQSNTLRAPTIRQVSAAQASSRATTPSARRSTIIAANPATTRQQLDWLTLTQTSSIGPTLRSWQRRSHSKFGRYLFARAMGRRAPYVRTLKPRFMEVRPTLCRVGIEKRTRLENRAGSLHTAAMGNLCELTAAMVTEVTIPATMRFAARGMTIEYLRDARTGVSATARLDKTEWREAETIAVPVSVLDSEGAEVVRAVVTMHVSPLQTP